MSTTDRVQLNITSIPLPDHAIIRRVIHPQTRVLDEREGLVEYIASDESLDSYNEVIRADGWRFSRFQKNAPFVDSHKYDSLEYLLGQVVDFGVRARKLIEVVKWAIDVPTNRLAQIGWAMTRAGYLRAVSVGFQPLRWLSRWDGESYSAFADQIKELGLDANQVKTIYVEQEQIELSSVIIGANPNAVARSYKAGALSDDDIDFLSSTAAAKSHPAQAALDPALAARARERARAAFLERFERALRGPLKVRNR
jgi:hypothetical protein